MWSLVAWLFTRVAESIAVDLCRQRLVRLFQKLRGKKR